MDSQESKLTIDDILAQPDYVNPKHLPNVSLSDIFDDPDVDTGKAIPVPDEDSDTDEQLQNILKLPEEEEKSWLDELVDSTLPKPKPPTMKDFVQKGFSEALTSDYVATEKESFVDVTETPWIPVRNDVVAASLEVAKREVDVNLFCKSQETVGTNAKELKNELLKYRAKLKENEEGKKHATAFAERPRRTNVTGHSVVSMEPMITLANKLREGKMKRSAGTPTVIAVEKYIIVGTSNGVLVVFDLFQNLVRILGAREGLENGAVTSVDISPGGEYLVAGHQTGKLVLWDFEKGTSLKVSEDHKVAIASVFFVGPEGTRQVISSDIAGNVIWTTYRKIVGYYLAPTTTIINSEWGFGEYKDMALLKHTGFHLCDKYNLLAFATLKQITVIACLDTGVQTAYEYAPPHGAAEGVVPLISWRKVPRDTGTLANKVADPVLAVVWGRRLKMLQVIVKPVEYENAVIGNYNYASSDDLIFVEICDFMLDHPAKAIKWLDSQVLSILYVTEPKPNTKDTGTFIGVFDPFTRQTLEVKPLNISVQYHVKNEVPTLTGPPVPENACFQDSLVVHNGVMYLLGFSLLYEGKILSWTERLDALVQQKLWNDVIGLALDFHQCRAQAVAGLPAKKEKAQKAVGDRLDEILKLFVTESLADQQNKQPAFFQQLALTAIETCVTIERPDILFKTVFPLFQKSSKEGAFFEKLEPFILADLITVLPDEVIARFAGAWVARGFFKRLESAIIHIDLKEVDFKRLVGVCRQFYLNSALAHVLTTGIDDWILALDDMLAVLMDHKLLSAPERRKYQTIIGLKTMDYFTSLMRGVAYPIEVNLPLSRHKFLIHDVFSYLFVKDVPGQPPFPFPRAATLIRFDGPGFFEALGIVYDDPRLNTEKDKLTQAVECLLAMMDFDPKGRWPFTPPQQTLLFCFIAEYQGKKVLTLKEDIVKRTIVFLTTTPEGEDPYAKKRENSLLILVKSLDTKATLSTILPAAEKAHLWKVCEYYYTYQKDYRKVVDCHIKHDDFHAKIFDFISDLMVREMRHRDVLKTAIFENMAPLMDIDAKKGTMLITNAFHDEHYVVMNELENDTKLMYSYLKGLSDTLLETKSNEPGQKLVAEEEHEKGDDEPAAPVEAQPAVSPRKSSPSLIELFSEKEEEKFIGLQCEFEPHLVRTFLKKHNSYRDDIVIRMVAAAGINDALAYMQEKVGQLQLALGLHLQALNKAIAEAEPVILNPVPGRLEPFDEDQYPTSQVEKSIHDALMEAIGLCVRSKEKHGVPEKEAEHLWFQVLDAISGPLTKYKNMPVEQTQQNPQQQGPQQRGPMMRKGAPIVKVDRLKRGFTQLMQIILQQMMSHLALASIVQKMVADNGQESFGGFRNIFMSMLDVTSYERNILSTANRLVDSDVFLQTQDLTKWRTKAYPPPNVSTVVVPPPVVPGQQPPAAAGPGGQPQQPQQAGPPAPAPAQPQQPQIPKGDETRRYNPENFVEPQAPSKIPLLTQLLTSSNLVPPADFGGHVDVSVIASLDQRPIVNPQAGRLNSSNVKTIELNLNQAIGLFGQSKVVI